MPPENEVFKGASEGGVIGKYLQGQQYLVQVAPFSSLVSKDSRNSHFPLPFTPRSARHLLPKLTKLTPRCLLIYCARRNVAHTEAERYILLPLLLFGAQTLGDYFPLTLPV